MKVELKNIKVHKQLSEETDCFSATLHVNGQRCAEVSNRGCGGPNEFHVLNRKLFDEFETFAVAAPPWDGLKMDAELYVTWLLDLHEREKEERKLCKKGIVFRLKGDPKNQWRILKGPVDQIGRDQIKKQFGESVAEILNDKF